MALPRSVQSQADTASKHFSKEEVNPDASLAPANGDPSAPATPEGEPKLQPDTEAPPLDDSKQPAEKPLGDDAKPTPDRDALYWQHRHDVMAGKYNKEVPALHAEVKQLKKTIEELETKLKTAQSTTPAQSDGVDEAQIEEFRQTYGEDFVDMVVKLASRQSPGQQQDSGQVEKVAQDVERMKQEKLEDQKARFWADFTADVPDWQEINNNPEFHRFLMTPIPNGGYTDEGQPVTPQHRLNQAQQYFDARTAAGIFKDYKNQTSTSAKEQQARRDQLEKDVEPRSSRSTETPASQDNQRIWTGEAINTFYRDKSMGRYSKDEAIRLEADLFAAQRQGRTRP